MSGYKIKQMITSLSDKADDAKTEVLSDKTDELEEDYDKEVGEEIKDEDDVEALSVKADKSDCEECLTEAPQKAGFKKRNSPVHGDESAFNQRGNRSPMNGGL